MAKNKILTILSLTLLMTMIIPLMAIQTSAAVTMKTYPHIGAMPNPIGVGQETLLHVGISAQSAWPQVGWEGLTVTVTKPDNTTQTLGPFTTDTTGGTGTTYTPTMVGTYYLQTNFPEQICENNAAGIPAGTVMQASQSDKLALIVTEEPRTFFPDVPLPTEYWTRPINTQFRSWGAVGGNWLATPNNRYAPYNDAPEAPHILWARPLAEGGVVGGDLGANGYETGDAYEGKYVGHVIINGVVYINRQIAQNQMAAFNSSIIEQTVVAIDLSTGEIIWEKVLGNNERLAFGQTMYWQTMNMYGGFAYLWTTVGTTWNAYDPLTGRWEWSIKDVPSGTRNYGPNGEILIYTVNTANGWMTQWNSTSVVYKTYFDYYMLSPSTQAVAGYYSERWRPQGIVFNASKGYDWNVTISKSLSGSANGYFPGELITGGYINSTGRITDQAVNMWAVSLKPGQIGTLLYDKTWQPPAGGLTLSFGARNAEDNVITIRAKEIAGFFGFNMRTGDFLWGPTEPRGYMDWFMGGPSGENGMMANGILYLGTVAGALQAIDVTDGKTLWTYNNTQPYTELMWGGDKWPIEFAFISDGKVYLLHTEHSGNSPLPRGAPFVCLNATTGEVIFRVDGLLRHTVWGGDPMIADSTIVTFCTYDNRIYAVGKGPSQTTITAPSISVPWGSQVVLSGSVLDIAAGTQEFARTSRFPNGVPAVSDESMGEWMKYVYQQFPRPTNATGVPVTLSVVDANGNYRDIGSTTTSADGVYSFTWIPDIPGDFTVYASFTGSESYWPSHAQAAFVVEQEQATPAPTVQPQQGMADAYFLPAIAGLFVLIIIVLVLVVMMMLKKRP